MKVLRSKVIGFCFGVSNTIENASKCIEMAKQKGCPCYSIGNLIHNEDVVKHFQKQGLVTIETPSDAQPGIALVRAHGIPDSDRRAFQNAGYELLDSTCPIVAKGSNHLRNAALKGKRTMVIGVKGHAETVGLLGVEVSEGKIVQSALICSMDDAKDVVESGVFDANEEIVVVTQTTFKAAEFQRIRKYLKESYHNIRFSTSPCGASTSRVAAVLELAKNTDAIVVVGGKASENTKGLAIAAAKVGKPVFEILNETEIDDAMKSRLSGFETVGICSGSSTPTYVLKAVEDVLSKL